MLFIFYFFMLLYCYMFAIIIKNFDKKIIEIMSEVMEQTAEAENKQDVAQNKVVYNKMELR